MKKDILYIAIIGLLLYFMIDSCFRKSPFIDKGRDTTTITIEVDTIKIPADTSRVRDIPKPKIVYKDNPKLQKALDSIKNYNDKLLFLLSKLTIKDYDTTYVFEKGSVNIFEKIQGEILEREVEMIINEFEYEQITIREVTTKYPKFALSIGVSAGINAVEDLVYSPSLNNYLKQSNTNPYVRLDFGYKNNRGYEYGFRTNFKNNFEIALKKDIFVKY